MKLRNKKTGEIGNLVLNTNPNRESYSVLSTENGDTICGNLVVADYDTLAELNKDWEDYEGPETYYYISDCVNIESLTNDRGYNLPEEIWHKAIKRRKVIGNYFETEEEAEKAVEKLKAWKRLKDKGFEFEGIKEDYTRILQSQDPFRTGKRYLQFNKSEDEEWMKENWQDLDLLFGGEK